MPKIRVWDFGAAKGTGASVVEYDPHADLTHSRGPTQNKRASAPKQKNPTTQELLARNGVDRVKALSTAYKLANIAENKTKPIPQDVRIAVARMTLRVSGNQSLAHQILHGEYDEHLIGLLP